MLEQFDDTSGNQGIIQNHLCCDVCAQDCQCGERGCPDGEETIGLLLSKWPGNYSNKVSRRLKGKS